MTEHRSDESAFTFAVLPDSQRMTSEAPAIYHGVTRWLVEHATGLGLRLVVHVGDVVDGGAGDEAQYAAAARAHSTVLDAGIPLLVTAGNHDYDDMLAASRSLQMFNRYVGSGVLADRPWYGGSGPGGGAENSYALLDGPGGGLLAVMLEFGPRPDVVAWADEVLTGNAGRPAIVLTHSYLDPDAERTQSRSRFHPRAYPATPDALDGDELWQRLIRRHSDVVMVLCGHQVPGPVSHRVDLNDAGRPVLQSFQNWQCAPAGLFGCIRIVALRADRIVSWIVNTETGEVTPGPAHEIVLPLSADAAGQRFPARAEPLCADAWPS